MNRTHVITHLSNADPKLVPALGYLRSVTLARSNTPFADLLESIIGQQLSTKAGDTIIARFRALVPGGNPMPEHVLGLPDETLRQAGISGQKITYMKSLAEAVAGRSIDLAALGTMPDKEIVRTLTAVKGIGPWTAEMFLMFSLGREDVFSFGDLGLRRAIQLLYDFRKEPSRIRMERIVNKWRPYRTYAALALWRYKDS